MVVWLGLLTACATLDEAIVAQAASEAPAPITISGNEPGWRVEISAAQSAFILNYGERRFTEPTPVPTIEDGVATYEYGARDIIITISDDYCEDVMSGMPYPETAMLREGEATLNGCGGNSVDLLAVGEWVVEDIGNGGIVDNSRVTMVFEPTGRVSGRASCNTYSGAFTLTGEGVSFGPLATTRMACAPALMNQEMKFLTLLGLVERFEIDETGALLLYGGGERRILARR